MARSGAPSRSETWPQRRQASRAVQTTEAAQRPTKKPMPAASIEKNTSATGDLTCPCGHRLFGTRHAFFRKERLSRRKHDLGPRRSSAPELEPAVQLVADEGADDREAGAVGASVASGAGVDDREQHVPVPKGELDANVLAAVLERVLQQLAEDERERRRPRAGERYS